MRRATRLLPCILWLASACSDGDESVLDVVRRQVTLPHETQLAGEPVAESDDIALDYSPGTLSALAYAASPAGGMVTVSRVHDPEGRVVAALRDFEPGWARQGRPVRPMDLLGSTAFVLPENEAGLADDAPAGQGVWRFRLLAPAGTRSATVGLVRRVGPAQGAGTLDVNLFFVDGSGLSSKDLPRMTPMFDAFFTIWSKARIAKGEVEGVDIVGEEATRFVAVNLRDEGAETAAALSELGRVTARAARARALNVFFVRTLDGKEGVGGILGLSLGIPGALGLAGETLSGVLLSVSAHSVHDVVSMKAMGDTLAHEAAHAMGLFHTSEASAGGPWDLIDDTPECPASADGNGDKFVDPFECAAYGSDNFLFWGTVFGATKVTAGQAAVLLRSPIVRGR